MSVSLGALNTPASIGIMLLFCVSCAESKYTAPASVPNSVDQSLGNDLDASYDAQRTDMMPFMTDQGANTQDLYIPPVPIDMGVLDPEEVAFTLRRCVERMLDYLSNSWMRAGCDTYTMPERSDTSSGYSRDPIIASCMKLECTGQTLEGHNGIPSTRTCRDIDDLVATLTGAEADADAGTCGTPTFRLELIELDDFMGPEPCDALICGLEADGSVIAVDQRN